MEHVNYEQLIAYAIKAPSGHNSQPWKFKIEGNVVEIYPDYSHELPVVDPDHRELFISLGCAAENLVLAGKAWGLNARVYTPSGVDDAIRVEFTKGLALDAHWLLLMDKRQSNRHKYTGKPIPQADLTRLQNVEGEVGIKAKIVTDQSAKLQLVELVQEANSEQMKNQAYKDELITWMRFNKREARTKGDGLTYAVLGNPALPFRAIGSMIVKSFLKPDKQNSRDNALLDSSSAFMVFSIQKNDKTNWIKLGRYFERIALTATELGIVNSHYNQPFETKSLEGKVNSLTFLNGSYPCLMIRLGYAKPMPYSPRRSIGQAWYT
ncbi:hypothetical protein H7X68_00670 [Candidatus Saccharibacteria bacterium]|nr:hypothetical protein [Candidatus Saccharibacteria bacterium]